MSALEDVLRRVAELDRVASPGPWATQSLEKTVRVVAAGGGSIPRGWIARLYCWAHRGHAQADINGVFISESRTLLPRVAKALAAAVDGLEQLKNCHRSYDAIDTRNKADDLLDRVEAVLRGEGE